MAVRADKIALGRFGSQPFLRHARAANGKVLGPRISMMELQRANAGGIATVDAVTSTLGDQLRFDPPPTRLLTSVAGRITALTARGDDLVTVGTLWRDR